MGLSFPREGGQGADARSIFQILLLSASLGTLMTIEADGADEQEALNAMSAVFATDEEDLSGCVAGPDVAPCMSRA